MNKMLHALRQLQGKPVQAARPAEPVVRSLPVVASVPTAGPDANETAAPAKQPTRVNFDVSAWEQKAADIEALAAPPPADLDVAPVAPSPPLPSAPAARGEAPWERAARADLGTENGNAYRQILTQLRRDLPANAPRSVFLAGVGCTSEDIAAVALRVGILNATGGLATLLVDADHERHLTAQLLADQHPGLREALDENIPVRHFLIPTSAPELQLLPYGVGDAPLESSSLPAFSELLDELKARTNLVLFAGGKGDSPLGMPLARACDGSYLVVRLGVATGGEAARLRQTLFAAGARLLGCIALDGEANV